MRLRGLPHETPVRGVCDLCPLGPANPEAGESVPHEIGRRHPLRRSGSQRPVQGCRGAYQRLERGFVDVVPLMDIERAPGVALEA